MATAEVEDVKGLPQDPLGCGCEDETGHRRRPYDSRLKFAFLTKKGIEPAIKVRHNSPSRARGCPAMKEAVLEYLREPEAWKRRVGYGLRWMAEAAFSPSNGCSVNTSYLEASANGPGDAPEGVPVQPRHEPEPGTFHPSHLKEVVARKEHQEPPSHATEHILLNTRPYDHPRTTCGS